MNPTSLKCICFNTVLNSLSCLKELDELKGQLPNIILSELFNYGTQLTHVYFVIRTDFILENIFAHLIENEYNFYPIRSRSEKEKKTFEHMKEIVDDFRENYGDPVRRLASEITIITEDMVERILVNVADELFSEGISWSKIVAFCVFVGELTIMYITKGLQNIPSFVAVIYERFSCLIKRKLEWWVENKGGWQSLLKLSVEKPREKFVTSKPSLIKHFLYYLFRIFVSNIIKTLY